MRKKMQKYTAAMMAAIMSLTAAPAAVSAADEQNVVIIGDSISAGTSLLESDKSYAEIIDNYNGVNVQNFSVEGGTTQEVLDLLSDSAVQSALESADVIVVTAGIHDIMDPFMAKADEYMLKWGFEKFEDVFFAALADYNLTETDLLIYNAELVNAAKANKETAKANMLAIGEALSGYEGRVVLQKAYNSIDTIKNLDELSTKRKSAYESICNVVSTSLNESVNAAIDELSASHSYEVVDVHAGFLGKAYKYANLSELDVNPTAEGHKWIAAEVLAAAGLLRTGDADADNKITSLDAAAVLMHAASVGAGETGSLGAARLEYVDVNGTGDVDSADAAKILIYAAEEGSGGTPSWN